MRGLSLLVLCGLLPGLAAPAAAADRVDFSGAWLLDEDRSDNPGVKMSEAIQEADRMMKDAAASSGSMGGSGPTGTIVTPGAQRDPEAMQRKLEKFSERFREMTVTHEGEELVVEYADGQRRVMVTDGKKHYRESGIGDLETRSKWKNDRELQVKAVSEDGRKFTEAWQLEPDGTLSIEVSMKGHRHQPPFRFTLTYELAPPE